MNEGELKKKVEYQALIESIAYAIWSKRPDLAQALGSTSQFCSNPREEHWMAAKRIQRYIKGEVDYGICYNVSKETDQTGRLS